MSAESDLAGRVLDALLRENYGGLAERVEAGSLLRLPGGAAVPLEPDGFLQELVVRRPAPVGLEEVLAVLARIADPADDEGVAAFAREAREALAGARLLERRRRSVLARLEGEPRLGPGTWYDTLAAFTEHPVHPTSRCRLGLSSSELRRYAPEHRPTFGLHWAALPGAAVVRSGDLPPWWPAFEGEALIPVHPLTVRLLPPSVLVPGPRLTVSPTLSVRTVAVHDHPGTHVKLPLATSTLGLRNRRTLLPQTLDDAALVERVLRAVLAREPGLRVLLAGEGTYGHAGHDCLAYLVRRLPAGLETAHVVPVAALAATAPSGRTVIEELAPGGPLPLFEAYLRLLFDWHVTLFVRYGVALEAHQQNTSLVLDGSGVRLLFKDYDGTLSHHRWLRAALGPEAPAPDAFADQRMVTDDPGALVDVFVTIAVHLCAGAVAVALASRGMGERARLLALVRRCLETSLDRHAGDPRAELLRARVLEADRLPGKAMVTAGTLVDKARTGARDINKHYGVSGPNYLRG